MSTSKPTTTSTSLPSDGKLPTLTQRVPAIKLPGISGGVSPQEAKDWFASLKYTNRNQYNTLTSKMAAIGIPKAQYAKVWAAAVAWAGALGHDPTKEVRITDFLDMVDPSEFQGTAKAKYGTSINKQIQTTQYSASDAAATLNKTMEAELGRTATAEETAAYQSMVNAQAMKSPAVGTYTTTTSAAPAGSPANLGMTTTQSVQQTGFDPTILAQNFARSMPDFAESYAAKNFMTLIERVLKDPNAIGKVVQ